METEHLNKTVSTKQPKYFEVYHVYEDENDEHVKFIGLFSSPRKAWQVIKLLRKLPGFKEHSQKAFKVSKIIAIDDYEWKDGFCTVDEALKI